MHPIERLRYVAGAGHLGPGEAALEAAWALTAVAGDPQELLVACRRLLERHPAAGPLWWLCARTLVAADPRAALHEAAELIEHDPTYERALDVIPDDALLLEAWAAGPDGFLAVPGSADLAADMWQAGIQVWVACEVGRPLPGPLWEAARDAALGQSPPVVELMAWSAVTHVMGPSGPLQRSAAGRSADCPLAPELMKRSTHGQAP